MVQVLKKRNQTPWLAYLPTIAYSTIGFMLLIHIFDDDHVSGLHNLGPEPHDRDAHFVGGVKESHSSNSQSKSSSQQQRCPYTSIADLAPEELHPVAGPRHMVTPPEGGPVHLVCCQTTKGPLNIMVHEKWAELGSRKFLEMVNAGYFSSTVPMMRCIKNFLCQFGLNSDPELSKKYRKSFPDDPNWLPEGPTNRENEQGVKRFAFGYLAYAGGGKNSRTNQFIVSLKDVPTLAGGSPWEVPWGELVGQHSFDTISKIYTGYGENGPPQGKLMNQGVTDEVKKEFPDLDYILGCSVVDERTDQ